MRLTMGTRRWPFLSGWEWMTWSHCARICSVLFFVGQIEGKKADEVREGAKNHFAQPFLAVHAHNVQLAVQLVALVQLLPEA